MKHIHFLGIGGSGGSAIAAIAQSQGYKVSGCDKNPFNEFTKPFDKEVLFEGHSPDHLNNIDILAVTPAIFSLDPNNPELVEAKKLGIPVMTWQEFMGKYLEQDKFVIAISGTHGKSTTTAMIGQMLEDAGLDPTVELGAIVPKWGSNYRIGRSKYFVTEADEFNNNFLVSHPNITVVTNIDWDHPEFFKTVEEYQSSFRKFLNQTSDAIVANIHDPGISQVLKEVMKDQKITCFDYSKSDFKLNLQVIGDYNHLNAQAACQVGTILGIEASTIQKSLNSYMGLGKRMEKLGQYQGGTFYSDFGHHPTEVKVTIEAVRQNYPNSKIWLVFQPHMFSRTHALFTNFVKVFKELPVDQIFISDIYPSREVDTGLVNSRQLVEAINKPSVKYMPDSQEISQIIKQQVGEGDIVVFQGATDIDKIGKELINEYR